MTLSIRAFAALLTGLVVSAPGHLRAGQVVKIDGSSTVFPITEAVAEEFQKSTGNKVTVGLGYRRGIQEVCPGGNRRPERQSSHQGRGDQGGQGGRSGVSGVAYRL